MSFSSSVPLVNLNQGPYVQPRPVQIRREIYVVEVEDSHGCGTFSCNVRIYVVVFKLVSLH